MEQLEPNPSCVRTLRDAELERVKILFSGSLHPLSRCVTCSGNKSFLWRRYSDGEVAEFECNCREQYILSRYLLHSGIDLRYQRFGWQDITGVTEEALGFVLDYGNRAEDMINAGIGLLLGGTKGSGKSLLSALLLKMLVAQGYDCYFIYFPSMISFYTSGWKSDEEKAWFRQRITNAAVLVIDDIGREIRDTTESLHTFEAMLDDVVRSRISGCRPTIITTNLSEEKFMHRYKANVLSLLDGNLLSHEFTGESFRKSEAQLRLQEKADGLTRPVVIG